MIVSSSMVPNPKQFADTAFTASASASASALEAEKDFDAFAVSADSALLDNVTAPFFKGYRDTLSNSLDRLNAASIFSQRAHLKSHVSQVKTQQVQYQSEANVIAQDLYANRDKFWARGMIGFAAAMSSPTVQWVTHALNYDAAIAESMNPIAAMANTATGFDPITGRHVSVAQGIDAFGSSMVGLFGGEAVVPVLGAAAGYLGDAGVSVARNWVGMFGKTDDPELNNWQILYHSKATAEGAQGVLDGINPDFFKENSRFGKAFYLSEDSETTSAELAHHNTVAYATIRYTFNKSEANILDLTDEAISKKWGYMGGEDYSIPQMIAKNARIKGFNVIRFSSERADGINLAVLNDFDRLLEPKMVFPASTRELKLTSNIDLTSTISKRMC